MRRTTLHYLVLVALVLVHIACYTASPKISDTPPVQKVAQRFTKKEIARLDTQEQKKIRRILEQQESGALSREEAVRAIDKIFKDREKREKQRAKEKVRREKAREAYVLKKLHKYCKKHGDIDDKWGAAPCNTIAFYNELHEKNEEQARAIIVENLYGKKKIKFRDLENTTMALLLALGKDTAAIKAYEAKRNSAWNIPAQNNNFRSNKDPYMWRHPPYKKDIAARLKKIRKRQKEIDKLFEQYRKIEFKKKIAIDVREKLQQGKKEAEQSNNQIKIDSYTTLLTPGKFERYVDRQLKKLDQAAIAASEGAQLREKEAALADDWLNYLDQVSREMPEKLNKERYKQLLQECDKIELDALSVAGATMVKGEEKEILLKGYFVRLKEISKELAELKAALKAHTDAYSILERIGKTLKAPFKKN